MKLLLFCAAVLCLSCNRHIHTTSNPVATVNGNTMLLGKITAEHLQQPPFSEWYKKEYAAYSPDAAVKDSLQNLAGAYRYEIFLGTWCGDSKREVPRLMKVLDELHVKPSHITIITVGNNDTLYKQSPTHEEQGKAIYRVPHLNIYRNGKEVGRVTETPVKTWEKDLLTIIRGQPYTPAHALLMNAGKLIELELKKNNAVTAEELVEPVRNLSLHSGQLLNSYGYVKLYSNEPRAAFLAFKINTLLFPDAWYTYNAMASWSRLYDAPQEKFWLQQVLQKKPDDEVAKKRLAVLK
jgi:thiol-disulfide isomerase/thioredoxin